MNETIKRKLDLLPNKPGSYQMKDKNGTIIYVGKAKSLVKRVKQYFTRPQVGKVMLMVQEITDLDWIETHSEKEAFLLEINLIQKYYPKYNILLKDGRMYPYIGVKRTEQPVLKIFHKQTSKAYDYFGPYPDSNAAHKVMELLNRTYPVSREEFTPGKPSFYYYLAKAENPVINDDEINNFDTVRDKIKKFLNGDTSEVISFYRKKMEEASDNLNFEQAGEYKQIIQSINATTEDQKIMMKDKVDRDVFAFSTREGYVCMLFLLYRKGILLGKNLYINEVTEDFNEELQTAICQFYLNHPKPKELIVSDESLGESLKQLLDLDIVVPTQGIKKDILSLALENAKAGLDAHFMTARLEDDTLDLLKDLQEKLHMDRLPLEIELFDNAHTQGQDAVGGMVTYVNGKKAPELYRRFNIHQPNKADDMASMREVIYRRCSRIVKDNLKAPDLIIVDGGITQVEAAIDAISRSNIKGVKLAGLVKNDKHETNSLMDVDTGELIPLDKKSPLFFLLMRMQDEVHRYAITTHRNKRAKSLFSTFFDDIPGVGDKKKERLLNAYPTMDSLLNATVGEISQLTDDKTARLIFDKIQKSKKVEENLNKKAKILIN